MVYGNGDLIFKSLKNNLGKQYLLSLLDSNVKKGKNILMKELFFISKNIPSLNDSLRFNFDDYGPNSDVVMEYINDMGQIGLIKIEYVGLNKKYTLGKNGSKFLETGDLSLNYELIDEIKGLCDDLTNDELLLLTYFSAPESTRDSLVFSKLMDKRIQIAMKLYKKEKISLEKAIEISGLSFKEFLNLIRSKKEYKSFNSFNDKSDLIKFKEELDLFISYYGFDESYVEDMWDIFVCEKMFHIPNTQNKSFEELNQYLYMIIDHMESFSINNGLFSFFMDAYIMFD